MTYISFCFLCSIYHSNGLGNISQTEGRLPNPWYFQGLDLCNTTCFWLVFITKTEQCTDLEAQDDFYFWISVWALTSRLAISEVPGSWGGSARWQLCGVSCSVGWCRLKGRCWKTQECYPGCEFASTLPISYMEVQICLLIISISCWLTHLKCLPIKSSHSSQQKTKNIT